MEILVYHYIIILINDSRFILYNDSTGNISNNASNKKYFIFNSSSIINGGTGIYSTLLTATSLTGNSQNMLASFIIDNTAPMINTVSINNIYTNDDISLVVNATDNYAISSVYAQLGAYTTLLSYDSNMSSITRGKYVGTIKGPSIPGIYNLTVMATDIAQNSAIKTINTTISEGPDLTLNTSDITIIPNTVLTGGILNISATIHNIGGKNASSAMISFYVNDNKLNSTDNSTYDTR